MGSEITLDIGSFSLDYGKNDSFQNHSFLFRSTDVKDIPYYYADDVVISQPGFSRRLGDIQLRLELLGYSLANVRRMYEQYVAEISDFYEQPRVSFEELLEAFKAIDVDKMDFFKDTSGLDVQDYGNIFLYPELNKIISLKDSALAHYWAVENVALDAYLILRLLMENPKNLERELWWKYADVVGGGWVTEEELFASCANNNADSGKFLIVTEGSTDLYIIKKSLEFIYPDVADLFYFVDMTEHYPFGGTGNLYRFCEGLCSIKIRNTVLVIFDNDTAGIEMQNQTQKLKVPSNMRITRLPDLSQFENFRTIGPSGESREDINRRAVSIECFLDLNYKNDNEPMVRWLAYNEKCKAYQGVLVDKEKYFDTFRYLRVKGTEYNFSKLEIMLQYIFEECKQLV